MHTIWKGAIAFGLVNVPVKLYSATEEQDISFKYVHRECGSHLNYVRSCPSCEREVEWDHIVKGYEYEKGKYVLFEKDELEQILPESSKEIRSTEVLPHLKQESKIDAKGLDLARMLIAHMSKPFTELEYVNESKEQLIAAIQRKIAGEEIKLQPPYSGTPVIDLMAALQASLEALKPANDNKGVKRKKKSNITQPDTPSNTETA